MRVLVLLKVAAALVSPRQPAAPSTVRGAGEGGQFGGRKGCCWKADSYLNAMESPAEPEPIESTARRLTAGGPPAASNLWHHEWLRLLDSSLRKCSGTAILPAPDASPAQCSTVASSDDLVVVSHDGAEDPVFNYASKAALDLWEMDWETFTSTPSRFSAEPDEREARAELLRRVTEDGYVDDYCGVRISSSGKRFEVRDAYVWNVYDGDTRVGQAALFRRSGCKFL
jgi:hypothetical protein